MDNCEISLTLGGFWKLPHALIYCHIGYKCLLIETAVLDKYVLWSTLDYLCLKRMSGSNYFLDACSAEQMLTKWRDN